jgi:hypothetical protein
MIWKAMALMCILEGGEKSCPTVYFEETFDSKQECEVWLVRTRFYTLPSNKKIVLDDCYLKR